MNLPQTTYNDVPATALNGMVSEDQPYTKISRLANGAVNIGTLVLFGANAPSAAGMSPGQCKAIPDATASLQTAAGIVAFDMAHSPYTGASLSSGAGGQYADKDDVPIVRQGLVWVYCEGVVTQGNPAFVRCTAAGIDVTGQFKDGAAANFVALANSYFRTTTTGSGLALLEINL